MMVLQEKKNTKALHEHQLETLNSAWRKGFHFSELWYYWQKQNILFWTQKTKTIISIADDIFLNGNPHTYNKTQTPNKKDNMVCMFPEMRLFVLHQKNKKYLKQ